MLNENPDKEFMVHPWGSGWHQEGDDTWADLRETAYGSLMKGEGGTPGTGNYLSKGIKVNKISSSFY